MKLIRQDAGERVLAGHHAARSETNFAATTYADPLFLVQLAECLSQIEHVRSELVAEVQQRLQKGMYATRRMNDR